MTRTKYTQEQILAVLKEAEAGASTAELIRKHGIGQDTFYRWKRLYGGLQREELQRVRALEEENKRLKRVIADQALNLQLLQDKLGKRSWRPRYRWLERAVPKKRHARRSLKPAAARHSATTASGTAAAG